MQHTIELRKKKWIDFADTASPVNRLLLMSYEDGMPERPMLWWDNMRQREEWAYQRYVKQMEDLTFIPDHTIPFLSMITGTEIFAEAFGCQIHKPDNNNPYALPLIFDWKQLRNIKQPKIEDTNLVKLFESADRLKTRVGADALFGLFDIQTPMDIAALIWEKTDFFMALYDTPEAVHELSQMIKEFLFELIDEWFRRYGREFIAHFPDYYMPYGISMSEDEIGTVSSDMYQDFFEKELVEFSERYGAIGIHSCANSVHQWENLKRIPNLKILNLVREKEETMQSLDVFRDTCGQLTSYQVKDWDNFSNPKHVHLAQHKTVQTRDEARRQAEYFAEYGLLPEN